MSERRDGGSPDVSDLGKQRRDEKRRAIERAAVTEFSKHGIAGTSMAAIASAADMSRPALYQYFEDKSEIFASAFVSLFDDCADAALDALDQPGPIAERLDCFLQRFEGDLWERLKATQHADELTQAKSGTVAEAIAVVMNRLWEGLALWLGDRAAHDEERDGWLDLLRLSPNGFKSDQPSDGDYRQRLTMLARSVGADITQSSKTLGEI